MPTQDEPKPRADAGQALSDELGRELLTARAECALQHNYSCEHSGCALTDESGYRPQALKYVENYYALKAEVDRMRSALAELVAAHDTLQQCDFSGGPADYEQQRDALMAAWEAARAALRPN